MPARTPLRGKPRALFTVDGEEVLVTMACLKCHQVKPFSAFGLRRMADGKVRSIPWCGPCRSEASPKRPRVRQAQLPLAVPAGDPLSDAGAALRDGFAMLGEGLAQVGASLQEVLGG